MSVARCGWTQRNLYFRQRRKCRQIPPSFQIIAAILVKRIAVLSFYDTIIYIDGATNTEGGLSMSKDFLWITRTAENLSFYSDSAPKSNLSLRFASAIDVDRKKRICDFVRYLRSEFYFPIRCNVYFCDYEKFNSSKGGYCYGIFYSNDDCSRHIYPQIYIPAKMELYSVYSSLCHELTHYYQWYFLDDHKSDRSLEAQAGRYANLITKNYCNYCCKQPDIACNSCCGQ